MTLSPFDHLRQTTYCPYAKQAKIIELPRFDLLTATPESESACVRGLKFFTDNISRHAYHGAAIEVAIGENALSIEGVTRGFNYFLSLLAKHDDSAKKSMSSCKLNKEWQFTFSNKRIFLNVFAPSYPKKHSKFIDLIDSFIIFLQPEESFDYCGISNKNQKTKIEIRKKFFLAGMPYNGDLIDKRIEALLYIFPVDPFGAPIIWWESDVIALQDAKNQS